MQDGCMFKEERLISRILQSLTTGHQKVSQAAGCPSDLFCDRLGGPARPLTDSPSASILSRQNSISSHSHKKQFHVSTFPCQTKQAVGCLDAAVTGPTHYRWGLLATVSRRMCRDSAAPSKSLTFGVVGPKIFVQSHAVIGRKRTIQTRCWLRAVADRGQGISVTAPCTQQAWLTTMHTHLT